MPYLDLVLKSTRHSSHTALTMGAELDDGKIIVTKVIATKLYDGNNRHGLALYDGNNRHEVALHDGNHRHDNAAL